MLYLALPYWQERWYHVMKLCIIIMSLGKNASTDATFYFLRELFDACIQQLLCKYDI